MGNAQGKEGIMQETMINDFIDDPQHVNAGSCRWCGAAITRDPDFQDSRKKAKMYIYTSARFAKPLSIHMTPHAVMNAMR